MNKTEMISIRTTQENKDFIKENKLSITGIFEVALESLILEKGQGGLEDE